MELNSFFELFAMYSQFLGLSFSIKLNWTVPWQKYITFTKYLHLNLLESLYGIPMMDYRVNHILITSIIPISICMILLFLFKSPSVVLWVLVTMASIIGMLFGFFVYSFIEPQFQYKLLAIISAALLLLMLIIFIIIRSVKHFRVKHNYKLSLEDVQNLESVVEQIKM
eukprot:NODE_343_length_9136_cov_0.948656.p7 type:complete len:168 gc:universal NODE_343_length_9136_cov_0.948656:2982-2479(-)